MAYSSSVAETRCREFILICKRSGSGSRLQKDVDTGNRTEYVVPGSIARIGLYQELETDKIDVSHMTPEQTAERIVEIAKVRKNDDKNQICAEGG